jgi:hypothetical protein
MVTVSPDATVRLEGVKYPPELHDDPFEPPVMAWLAARAPVGNPKAKKTVKDTAEIEIRFIVLMLPQCRLLDHC